MPNPAARRSAAKLSRSLALCLALRTLTVVVGCATARTRAPRLFPFYDSQQRWGYMDRNGRTVIDPQFDLASEFSQGLAFVRLQDRSCGYIDGSGRMVVGPTSEWSFGRPFKEDRGVVRSRNVVLPTTSRSDGIDLRPVTGPAQYIDLSGRYITNHWYEACGDFTEGIGCADDSGKATFLNRSGRVLFQRMGSFSHFANGLVGGLVPATESRQYLYLDRRGRTAIPPRRDLIGAPFCEGLARVVIDKDDPGERSDVGYIDRRGKLVLAAPHGAWGDFSEGLAAASTDSGEGYIDHTGRLAIRPQWAEVRRFSEGLAAVGVISAGDLRWGYIDRTGRVVIPPRFVIFASEFSGGLAKVGVDQDRWSYVNRQGQMCGDTMRQGNPSPPAKR